MTLSSTFSIVVEIQMLTCPGGMLIIIPICQQYYNAIVIFSHNLLHWVKMTMLTVTMNFNTQSVMLK